ncbi:MAG: adenylate/guanylate cyclase domain-containing protein [Bryobacteraceae bacterium]
MIALSSVAVIVCSLLAYRSARTSLRDVVIRQLAGIRRSRAYAVKSYFERVTHDCDSLSDDRMFVEGMREFSTAYAQIKEITGPSHRAKVLRFYKEIFLPEVQRYMSLPKPQSDYLPQTDTAYLLQDRYVLPQAGADSGSEAELPPHQDIYTRVHAKYDVPIRKLASQFGYDDLLLIELTNLQIVYSVAKNPDFGTSLKSGPYRDTPLAHIVKQASTSDERDAVFLADFTRYEPARGKATAFIATPIFDGPTRVGVFALRITTSEIDRAISGNRGWRDDGLGETGDLQIVGSDHLLRSTARKFIEHPDDVLQQLRFRGVPEKEIRRLKEYGTTILVASLSSGAVENGLEGREGTVIESDLFGDRTFVSFMPLGTSGLRWMLLARLNVNEAMRPVRVLEGEMMLWGLLTILGAIAAALLVTNRLSKPISSLAVAAQRMGTGDLTARVEVFSNDELGILSSTFNKMAANIEKDIQTIADKNNENENLLLNILPGPIADRLKSGETTIADHYSEVTVLFADIVGFTTMSQNREPTEIVALLNGLFTRFDAIASKHGIEKIKTIGDAYMAVAGLPNPERNHSKRMVDMALEMLEAVEHYGTQVGIPLAIRIGINAGPVAAGVIGTSKFIYDLWGDTVNMASRMESTGVPGAIQVTRAIYEKLEGDYTFQSRGLIQVKGKGSYETWLVSTVVEITG